MLAESFHRQSLAELEQLALIGEMREMRSEQKISEEARMLDELIETSESLSAYGIVSKSDLAHLHVPYVRNRRACQNFSVNPGS
ncbi:hypothetical protein SAMN05518865_1052 [Duganella sp. CF458]|nr:hypothetical protein SAMN05518865_1052 [Duganella sp. CF458]